MNGNSINRVLHIQTSRFELVEDKISLDLIPEFPPVAAILIERTQQSLHHLPELLTGVCVGGRCMVEVHVRVGVGVVVRVKM